MIFPNTVHCGDAMDLMDTIPDNYIHLTVTSPPYDSIRGPAYASAGHEFLVELYTKLLRATEDGGLLLLNMRDSHRDFACTGTTLRTYVGLLDAGWRLFADLVAYRHGRPGAWWDQRFRVDHEYNYAFFKGDRPRVCNNKDLMVVSKWAGSTFHGTQRGSDGSLTPVKNRLQPAEKCRGTVWKYDVGGGRDEPEAYEHPAIMPYLLARDDIRCFSNPGDLVFDPMFGSGTTLIQAVEAKRQFLGFEIDPNYVDIFKRRMDKPMNRDAEKW